MSEMSADPRRAAMASKLLVIVLVGIFIFALMGFVLAVIDADARESASPGPASLAPVEQGSGTSTTGSSVSNARVRLALAESTPSVPPTSPVPASPGPADASPLPSADAVPVTVVESRTPVVPVVSFWSKKESLQRGDIRDALVAGGLKGFKRITVDAAIAAALAAELDIELHPDVQLRSVDEVANSVSRGGLGLVAATDLAPSMRALKLNAASLVGNDRVRNVADWPLVVTLQVPEGDAWDQARTWVLVAGGDSFTDRGVYDKVVRKGKGVDYPFAGGTAQVTGHGCCDPVFNDNIVPRYRLTGNKGMVRKLFRGAELAIANHEQPVTDAAVHHTSGLRFSGKPALTKIFTRAGIDFLSLANNHIKDYGEDGIRDTRRILRQNGIAFGGAGKDLAQARQVSYLEAGDTRVAIIPCLDIVPIYWAAPRVSGATPCLDRYLVPDIKKAAKKSDFVMVFPHWGVEYTRKPLPSMRKHAARWVKAGADMVLGAHSHVAGSIEDIDGAPVLYSLGNLIFDQHWSTNTMESALLEATFHGGDVIELRLRPYIIHDTSQPNFLDPTKGEGRALLMSMKAASSDWLDW
jgi:hypothetical protein